MGAPAKLLGLPRLAPSELNLLRRGSLSQLSRHCALSLQPHSASNKYRTRSRARGLFDYSLNDFYWYLFISLPTSLYSCWIPIMAPPPAQPWYITLKNGDSVKVNGASLDMCYRLSTQADFSQTTFTAPPAGRFVTAPLTR